MSRIMSRIMSMCQAAHTCVVEHVCMYAFGLCKVLCMYAPSPVFFNLFQPVAEICTGMCLNGLSHVALLEEHRTRVQTIEQIMFKCSLNL